MIPSRRSRSRKRDREPSIRHHIIVGAIVCSVMSLLGGGVWYVTRLPSVTIQEIAVTGGETIDPRTIERALNPILEGEYLHLVPHRFSFLYPHDALAAALGDIPRVKDFSIHEEKKTLHVSFSEYVPYALWCKEKGSSPCYFLDAEGYAFGESPLLQGGALTRHIVLDETELTRKQVFPRDRFKEMHAFLEALHDTLSLRVTDVEYTKEGDITLYVNGGGKILLRDNGPYTDALQNLETVLTSKTFKHLKPGNFQYIDIRFGNKVFVNEAPLLDPNASSSTATST
jgi:cell division septal protein FtsQ